MNFIRVIVILLILINCFLISAQEFDSRGVFSSAKFDYSIKEAGINNYMNLYASTSSKKTPIKTTPKIILTNKQKSAVAVNVTGAVFLFAGAGLLASSLAYADYLEKNETNFDKYIAGKNLSRGLFYGSMGGFGAGAVGIVVSIPLFVEVKKTNKPVYKKK
jgi:hypothetical protein